LGVGGTRQLGHGESLDRSVDQDNLGAVTASTTPALRIEPRLLASNDQTALP
jgi:hypothetical protein